jgi:type IV pilus assembly protein PilW
MIKSPRRQRGLSMVELLVSMALGLVVVGAVIITYTSSGASGARQNALAQMQEDVQLAFSLVSRDLQMAGYSEPVGIVITGGAGGTATFSKKYTGRPLFACSTPMNTATVALSASNEDGVTCSVAGSTATHSLVVNYEANASNAVVNAAGNPTNCLGSAASSVTSLATPTVTFSLVSNRYYVSSSGASGRPELSCAGPGVAGQPLVENVESIKLWMGQADAANPRRAVRYVEPADVGADWGTIVAVRICLLMRSAEPVLAIEDDKSYRDCSGDVATSADRRIRRAFYSTVALRNKTAF